MDWVHACHIYQLFQAVNGHLLDETSLVALVFIQLGTPAKADETACSRHGQQPSRWLFQHMFCSMETWMGQSLVINFSLCWLLARGSIHVVLHASQVQ